MMGLKVTDQQHEAVSCENNCYTLDKTMCHVEDLAVCRAFPNISLICDVVTPHTLLRAFCDAFNGQFNDTIGMLLSKPLAKYRYSSYRKKTAQ
jgi:hypothetical protein